MSETIAGPDGWDETEEEPDQAGDTGASTSPAWSLLDETFDLFLDVATPPDDGDADVVDHVDEEPRDVYTAELDQDAESDGAPARPFDPDQIRVTLWQPVIPTLLARIEEGALQLDPAYQRKTGVWDEKRQSRLVESVLLRIPLPSFYVDATDEDHMVVVDGVQRLTALSRFVNGKLRLSQLEFLTELDRCTYHALPRRYQRRIEETQVAVLKIDPPSPEDAKFSIFSRVNTGGLPLSTQELRQAMHLGPGVDLLKRLAATEPFRQQAGRLVRHLRLEDEELVLRVLAFLVTRPAEYQGPKMEVFLNARLRALNGQSAAEHAALAHRFERAVAAACTSPGADAFRKPPRGRVRQPFNRALFETWVVTMDLCADDELATLARLGTRLHESLAGLMGDEAFVDAISVGTWEPRKVKQRFSRVCDLVREVLHEAL